MRFKAGAVAPMLVAVLALTGCTGRTDAAPDRSAPCPDTDAAAKELVAATPKIGSNVQLSRVDEIHCSGDWAAVLADFFDGGMDESGHPMANTYMQILHLESGRWTYTNRDAACSSGRIPADLHDLACVGG